MNTSKGKKPVRVAPVRRANAWQKKLGERIRKLIVLLFATTVIGLMFSGLQAIGIPWLVSLLSILIISGMTLLYYNDGINTGVADTEVSRRVEKAEKENQHVMKEDDAACYSILRAVVAAGITFAIPIILAVIASLGSKAYTYTLQDLPAWLTQSYGARSDIMAPLGAYLREESMGMSDWVRLAARVFGMVYVNLFPDPLRQSHLIDQTLPLFFLLYPLGYIVGYLQGPRRQAILARKQRKAKKVAVKKAQKRSLAEELTRSGAEVHYGQRNDREDEKNRLI